MKNVIILDFKIIKELNTEIYVLVEVFIQELNLSFLYSINAERRFYDTHGTPSFTVVKFPRFACCCCVCFTTEHDVFV